MSDWFKEMIDKWGADAIGNALSKSTFESNIERNERFRDIHREVSSELDSNATINDMHDLVMQKLGITREEYLSQVRGSANTSTGQAKVPEYRESDNIVADLVSFIVNRVGVAHENIHSEHTNYLNTKGLPTTGPGSGPYWAQDEVRAYQNNVDMLRCFQKAIYP